MGQVLKHNECPMAYQIATGLARSHLNAILRNAMHKNQDQNSLKHPGISQERKKVAYDTVSLYMDGSQHRSKAHRTLLISITSDHILSVERKLACPSLLKKRKGITLFSSSKVSVLFVIVLLCSKAREVERAKTCAHWKSNSYNYQTSKFNNATALLAHAFVAVTFSMQTSMNMDMDMVECAQLFCESTLEIL